MLSHLKIGDFAELNNISVQALRYYEKIGLFEPVVKDDFTHYRYYDIEQSASIDMIQFLQSLDFSLEEIKAMLAEAENFDLLSQLLDEKERTLAEEMKSLENRLDSIKSLQESMSIYEKNKGKQEFEIIQIPQRYIFSYPINKNIYQCSTSEYEFFLREFKQEALKQELLSSNFNRVGSLMKRQDFVREEFVSKELFIFLPRKLKNFPAVEKIPGGKYAVFYCQSFAEELPALREFKGLIEGQGLQIMGDYLCEVVHEIPKLGRNERKMFIRLQIPVA